MPMTPAKPCLIPWWTASRLGDGMAGASTTVITADEIERSPGQTLQDVLARQPGIQVQNLFGGVNGTNSTVDLRGFGAAATPNTLVLINGRRLNDVDLSGSIWARFPAPASNVSKSPGAMAVPSSMVTVPWVV